MNKQLTPLEALYDLIGVLENEHLGLSEEKYVVQRKNIIETALLRLKTFDEVNELPMPDLTYQEIEQEIVKETKIKAFDAIKDFIEVNLDEHRHYITFKNHDVSIEIPRKLCILLEEVIKL